MAFNTIKEFIEMGGYGFYVWSCYAVVLFAMIIYYVLSKRAVKQTVNELEKFYRRIDSQNQNSH